MKSRKRRVREAITASLAIYTSGRAPKAEMAWEDPKETESPARFRAGPFYYRK